MIKKILISFLLISSFLLNAQSQTVNFVTAGGSLDYTNNLYQHHHNHHILKPFITLTNYNLQAQ